jgi:uncharacterized membrane protein
VIAVVDAINANVQEVRGEITFVGSFISLALIVILIIILMALFLPQRYDQIKEKVKEGQIKIYDRGEEITHEFFPPDEQEAY